LSLTAVLLLEQYGSAMMNSNGTLVYSSEYENGTNTLSTYDLSNGPFTEPFEPTPTGTYRLPSDPIQGFRVFGGAISVSTGYDCEKIKVFRLPDAAEAHCSLKLEASATFNTPGFDSTRVLVHHTMSPLYSSTTEPECRFYVVSLCGTLYRVQVHTASPHLSTCETIASPLQQVLHDVRAVWFSGLRVCTATKHPLSPELVAGYDDSPETPERLLIHFYPAPLTGEQAEMVRIRLGQPPAQSIELQWPGHIPRIVEETTVGFDEWTGLASLVLNDEHEVNGLTCWSLRAL
jgi:hypothetical protein